MKKDKKKRHMLFAFIVTAFCAVLGALGQLFFKYGSAKISLDIFSWIFNWQLILGIIFYVLATGGFIVMLKKVQLSLLYPVIATSYIWVAIMSIVFLGEKISLFNWLGFLLIIGGISLTSIKK